MSYFGRYFTPGYFPPDYWGPAKVAPPATGGPGGKHDHWRFNESDIRFAIEAAEMIREDNERRRLLILLALSDD